MIAWNGVYRLWRPTLSPAALSRLIRTAVVALGAAAGVIVLPVVSRLTARWDRPRPLRNVHADGLGPPGGR